MEQKGTKMEPKMNQKGTRMEEALPLSRTLPTLLAWRGAEGDDVVTLDEDVCSLERAEPDPHTFLAYAGSSDSDHRAACHSSSVGCEHGCASIDVLKRLG